MKRVLMLMFLVFAAGCTSSTPAGPGTSSTGTTELLGTWNVSGTGKSANATVTGTYQVKLVSSACTVTTPVGVFTVQGSVCFIANNNTGTGAIAGTSIATNSKTLGQGILVGVASDPVPDNAAINMVFVSASGSKYFQEFTGTATISGGKMTGSGACSTASTASCTGASATFTATHQ